MILNKNKKNIGYLFILSVLMLIPSTLAPIFRKVFTDQILSGTAVQWMPVFFSLMIGVALLSAVSSWLQNSCLLKLSNKIELSGAAMYIWKLLMSPRRFFDNKDSFVLLSQVGAAKAISRIITRDIIDLLFSFLSVVFYLVMMVRIDPFMTLVVLILVVLNVFIINLKSYIGKLFSGTSDDEDTPSTGDLLKREERISSETLQNIETYKSTASETFFFQRLMGNKTAIVNSRRDDDYEDACTPLEDFPEILFLNLLLVVSALKIMDRGLTIGTYLALQAYASAFFSPMNTLLGIRETLDGFDRKIGRLNKSLQLDEEEVSEPETEDAGSMIPGRLTGRIEFCDVSFEYEADCPVIKHLNLVIEPGQRIAITGPTGAGKTTLLKLLLGLYQPTSGCIKIDGRKLTSIDRLRLANDIGCASQEIVLFSDTIRNNITLWDDSITGSDIYRAASMACIHEYITSLDKAYDSQLQENGSNLSGGQKQMLEIARALLYDPTILIFDEALRSIDRTSARHIEAAIIKKACTYIEVTHILSQQIAYDQIIVMEQGRIAAAGTHEELLRDSDYYSRIFHAEGVYSL